MPLDSCGHRWFPSAVREKQKILEIDYLRKDGEFFVQFFRKLRRSSICRDKPKSRSVDSFAAPLHIQESVVIEQQGNGRRSDP